MLVVSVVAALAAGCTFAVGSVLQQSAAREAPRDEALSLRLLLDLAHRRRWLAGIASDAGSFGLQALALAFGPIALVQPLLVTGVLFAIPLAVRYRHRRLHAREWLATAAVAGGLAGFLAAARPSAGRPAAPLTDWIVVLAVVIGVALLAVAAGRGVRGPARASLFSVAAGCGFGLLAALTKTSTWLLGQGAERFFTSWQPYAMAVVALAAAVVQQSAFQAGPLPTSVPVMDAVEPTTAVVIGMFAFHEQLARSVPALLLETLGVLVLLAGIVVLDRSPLILTMQRAGDERAASRKPAAAQPTAAR